MCFQKKKIPKPLPKPVKAASQRDTATQPKVDLSKKKISSAPAKGPEHPIGPPVESQPDSSGKEKTCLSDRSDLMQISLYKTTKKKDGSGSGPAVKPADREQDSPEVFENNAQVESLNPVNVTQIFVDSVIPQTNVSKVAHTDIVDQKTLETIDPHLEDIIFEELDTGEEQHPEVTRTRPLAHILQPEDDTIAENTMSERRTRPTHSEKRVKPSPDSRLRTALRPPTTPDRLPSVFTPQPPTKSEKAFTTAKRLPSRGPLSTRTATVSRPRPSTDFRPAGGTPSAEHPVTIDNTCPSHEPLDRVTQRTVRPQQPKTEYRTVVQTATPMEPKDLTCPSREQCDSTAKTAKKTPGGAQNSNIYTAHVNGP